MCFVLCECILQGFAPAASPFAYWLVVITGDLLSTVRVVLLRFLRVVVFELQVVSLEGWGVLASKTGSWVDFGSVWNSKRQQNGGMLDLSWSHVVAKSEHFCFGIEFLGWRKAVSTQVPVGIVFSMISKPVQGLALKLASLAQVWRPGGIWNRLKMTSKNADFCMGVGRDQNFRDPPQEVVLFMILGSHPRALNLQLTNKRFHNLANKMLPSLVAHKGPADDGKRSLALHVAS